MKKLLLFILMIFLLFPANAYCEEDETATDETTVDDTASEPIAEDAPISDTIDEGDTAEEVVTDNIECEGVASEETATETIEEELLESGICGDNAFYKIYPDYSMVIEGSGALYDQQKSSISLIRNIKTVTISEGITHLGSYSFYRFSALNEVNLPNSLSSIGAHAFDGASKITSIYLPATITYLSGNNANDSAFYGTNAKLNVYLERDASAYEAYAFNRTAASRLRIIPNATRADYAFYANLNYKQNEITIPDGVTMIPDDCFNNSQTLYSIHIPDSVSYIGDYAFYNCQNLRKLSSLPSNLKYLGRYSFWTCKNLTEPITLPEGLEAIEEKTFANCEKLRAIYLPASIKSIGYYAFEDCYLLNRVEIPEDSSLEFIDRRAFKQCYELRFLYLPASIREIVGPANNASMCPFVSDRKLELFMAISEPGTDFGPKWNYGLKEVHYGAAYEDYLKTINDNSYKLHIIGNDDNSTEIIYDAIYDANIILTDLNLSCYGYSFVGFSENPDGSGKGIKANTKYSVKGGEPQEDHYLYVTWKPIPNTVKYYCNGGKALGRNPQRYLTGDESALYPCQKKGYEFLGWYDNPDFAGEAITNLSSYRGRISLYARYQIIDYDIKINPLAGEATANQYFDERLSLIAGIYSGSYNILSPVIRLPRLSKAGYSFKGWLNLKTNRRLSSIPQGSVGDYEIEAIFEPINYKITYNANSGRFVTGAIYSKNYNILSDNIILPDETMIYRNGYHFDGWYTSRSFEESTKVTSIDSALLRNITLYAKWTKN